MSNRRSVDRSAVTREKDRSATTPHPGRKSLCTFTFQDGRHCRSPRLSGHPCFCYFHARKEAQARAAEQIGDDISYFFSGRLLSASDLSSALGLVFAGVAQGQVKPKTASTLAYLGQTLLQTIQLAQNEFVQSAGPFAWREEVFASIKENCNRKAGNSIQDVNPHENQPENQNENQIENQVERRAEELPEKGASVPQIGASSE